MITLVEVLQRTTTFFEHKGIPTARLDAQLLLGHVLGLDRVKLYLNFDRPMAEPELETFRVLVRRRGEREPLAWLLGTKEFYGRPFTVGPGVLVPRPDTETLIERLLPELTGDPLYLADVGSGSGVIAITLALECPGLRVFAVEASPEAILYTRQNVERHGLKERVAVLLGRDLAPIPAARPLDWVVSNPPYIPSAALERLQPEVALREPRLALDGGGDGLDMYRRLIPLAQARARIGLAFEVGAGQADQVAALCGDWLTSVHTDLAGTPRVVIARRPEPPPR